ncbi:MAG TPA: OmpH family outer membrane protein [Fimbriiglobus sp.]|nr:OmpH family outer membrane protein [Fimbriiglobus sp.]
MKRAMVYLAVVGGAVLGDGAARAQAAGGAPAAAPKASGGKVAVFNVAKVMKDYQRWQYYASLMNQKRTAAAGELGKLRAEITKLQEDIQKEPIKTKQEPMAQALLARQREFEDKQRQVQQQLDSESAGYLRNLFTEIQRAVVAIVEQNGFDVVFAYPDAITKEEMESPLYYDLKMRPQAAMPFYVSPTADMTNVLIETLNKNFPPPKDPIQPAGGAAPHAPTPPAGAPGTPPKPGGM